MLSALSSAVWSLLAFVDPTPAEDLFGGMEKIIVTDLLELEPRVAGDDFVEPEIEFEKDLDQLPVDCLTSVPKQTLGTATC